MIHFHNMKKGPVSKTSERKVGYNKGTFDRELNQLPDKCTCRGCFNLQHASFSKTGGFISIQHNQIRNKIASLSSEICKDVTVEPILQQLTAEKLNMKSTNITDVACLDMCVQGFWNAKQKAYFI